MTQRIGDVLILTLTDGLSLKDWETAGLLDREWALYERLASAYDRIHVVSYGNTPDLELAARLGIELTCNTDGLERARFAASVPQRVEAAVGDAQSIVVKTNQMEGGDIAPAIAGMLRSSGRSVGLVARGGYAYSRFIARRDGSDAATALEAAQVEAALCRAADVIVGTSDSMVEDLAWRYGVSRSRTTLIPNYVIQCPDQRSASERDRGMLLYAGQLVLRKRVDVLVRAMAALPEESRQDLTLNIVGEGTERASLESLAEELGAPVVFRDRVPHRDLLEMMRTCSLYLQASEYEGHPKTVIEAMAQGCPVVVGAMPGTECVVRNGVTGLRIDDVPDAFAHAIEHLMTDAPWRDELGRAAANEAHERYGLETVMPLEMDAHRQALASNGSQQAASAGVVRWEPDLLNAPVASAVRAWSRSLRGFATRLSPESRARFLLGLDAPFYELQGEAAVAAEGLHPKHRLMRYHDFFVDRIDEGERVLDLGCGVGALAASIAERCGANVTGMDWSEVNLERARDEATTRGLAERLHFLRGDITRDHIDGSFDVIVLSNVLEHVTKRPDCLKTWRDWYGARRFLIRVPSYEREWRVPFKKELGVEWRLDDDHKTEFTETQLEDELKAAGLSITDKVIRWGEYWVTASAA